MEPVAEKLLTSPRLALHVRAFERVLSEERALRERFYDEVTEDQKAEFINGETIVHSPVRRRHHDSSTRLYKLLSLYAQINDLGFVAHEKVMISLTRNDYEPDVCFFGKGKAQAFSPDQWKFPAPDFVCEVLSPTTAANDRGVKFEDYAAHGVREYWLLDPGAEVAEQYVLDDEAAEHYALRLKSGSGRIASTAVAGFEVAVRALFDDEANLQAMRRLLQAG